MNYIYDFCQNFHILSEKNLPNFNRMFTNVKVTFMEGVCSTRKPTVNCQKYYQSFWKKHKKF